MKEDSYLGDVLKAYLQDVGRDDVIEIGEIHLKWGDIAGERLARWSEPASLQGGKLVIMVPAPVWANEVHMADGALKKKIEEETGIAVEEIRVKTDPAMGKSPREGRKV